MRSAHTQRCHESKACTSPATTLSFSQNKQPQRQRAASARAYSERTQAEKGDERGRAVVPILPPRFVARLCDTAGRRSPPHSPPSLRILPTLLRTPQTPSGEGAYGSVVLSEQCSIRSHVPVSPLSIHVPISPLPPHPMCAARRRLLPGGDQVAYYCGPV